MENSETVIKIRGMHCATCAISIEKSLLETPGVKKAEVSYALGRASVSHDVSIVNEHGLSDVIRTLGYQVGDGVDDYTEENEFGQLKIQLLVGFAIFAVLMAASMGIWSSVFGGVWIQAALASIVQMWIGKRFYVSAWRSLRNRMANMDVLISLGTSVAYFYSIATIAFEAYFLDHGVVAHRYFDTSVGILVFILLGSYLEERAKGRASSAIRELMRLQPQKALVLRASKWVSVPVEQLSVGDVVRVRSGDKIPVDGSVLEGASSVNESMVTGESAPVAKKLGDVVIGGSINVSGALEIKVTQVGSQTVLAGIISAVERAQASKARVQALVDQVSAVFVPVVIALACMSSAVWFFWGPEPALLHSVTTAIAVLVIACPCALGLATPTSLMVAIGRGAKEGILIKDAQALEAAASIDTMVFDKTGTLTGGVQNVQQFQIVDELDAIAREQKWPIASDLSAHDYLFSLILVAEERSSHPVSDAIMRYVQEHSKTQSAAERVVVDEFKTHPGLGIHARLDGNELLIGSAQLMERHEVRIPENIQGCVLSWQQEARTVSFVAVGKKLVAAFCLADTIREGAKQLIDRLKTMNIRSIMITGDNQKTAESIANQLGIDSFFARVLPEQKAKQVKDLCTQGRVVGMVGDGINDAPALAAAHVGMAMGGGTGVALETADIALLRNDLSLVAKVILLARATRKNIKQNLIWAFGYNVVLIPVAMGALYPFFGITLHPMLAGGAMAFSSLSVVINALRLRRLSLERI